MLDRSILFPQQQHGFACKAGWQSVRERQRGRDDGGVRGRPLRAEAEEQEENEVLVGPHAGLPECHTEAYF